MYKIAVKLIVLLGICGLFTNAFADTTSSTSTAVQNPVTQLQNMVNLMQQDVAKNRSNLEKDPDQLYQLVKQDILPDMAIQQMAAMALGPKWSNATPAQRDEFITQFSFMLTRAYASALLKVDQYNIMIYPLRSNAWQTSPQLALPGIISSSDGGEPSSVTYYVIRNGNQWAVYDFAIEGVSILQNFQAQLQSFPDIAAVIARLKQVNAGNV